VRSDEESIARPLHKELREPGAALRISAGSHHSLVVSRDGAVFTWGCGQKGRLGHSISSMDVHFPKQVGLYFTCVKFCGF